MNLPAYVRKRNDVVVRFDKRKIREGLRKTFCHLGSSEAPLISNLTERVCVNLERRGLPVISVGEIREAAIKTLKEQGFREAAAAYDLAFWNSAELGLGEIMKRDGRLADLEPRKIFKSIRKAFGETGLEDPKLAELITGEALEILQKRFGGKNPAPAEAVRETVARLLLERRLKKTANAYTRHRYF